MLQLQPFLNFLAADPDNFESFAKEFMSASIEEIIKNGAALRKELEEYHSEITQNKSKMQPEEKENLGLYLKKVFNNSVKLKQFCRDHLREDRKYMELFRAASVANENAKLLLEEVMPTLTNKSMDELFVSIGLASSTYPQEDVVKEIIARMDHHSPEKALARGPLNKSKYTYQLEELIGDILHEKDFQYEINTKNEHILLIPAEGKKYNVTEILRNGNLSHLEIEKEHHEKYVEFLKNKSVDKPEIIELGSAFPSEQDFITRDPEGEYKDLTYGEKLAINLYTGPTYVKMNSLLRGNPIIEQGRGADSLKEQILHVGFCASGLNHVPIKQYMYAVRGESKLPEEGIQDRISAVEKGEILTESGFVSTSSSTIPLMFKGKVKLLFTGGILGQDICQLSVDPQETEVLMVPTQIQWKDYKKDGESVYFHIQPVRTISGLTVEQREPLNPKVKQVKPKEEQETRGAPLLHHHKTTPLEKPSEQKGEKSVKSHSVKKKQQI